MSFPEILKELRDKKGFTQKQLAEALYLSKTTISQYENGTHTPSIETFIKLADIFDISIDYLLGRTSVPVTFSTLKKSFTSEENIDDFINMLLSLDHQHRTDLMKQMDYIKFHNDISKHQKKSTRK